MALGIASEQRLFVRVVAQYEATERDALRTQLADAQNRLRVAEQQAKINERDTTGGMNRYGPVDARVYLHSPSSWYQSLQINKGTNDGVEEGDPVINGAGLVGKVETATGGSAVVTLITDPEFATGGHYLEDCNEAPTVADDAKLRVRAGVREWALDEGNARRLWEVSEEHLARHRTDG